MYMNFLIVIFVMLIPSLSYSAISYNNDLDKIIMIMDRVIPKASDNLQKNNLITQEERDKIQKNINDIWGQVKNTGYATKEGSEDDWRESLTIMQGLLEKSMAVALERKMINDLDQFIIAPRMASPFIVKEQVDLTNLDTKNPMGLAMYRNHVLQELLDNGAIISTIYCYDATKNIGDDALSNFKSILSKYKNIKDYPSLKMKQASFPSSNNRSIYFVNGKANQAISIQSYQLSQGGLKKNKNLIWEIRFGEHAKEGIENIKDFLIKNDLQIMKDFNW